MIHITWVNDEWIKKAFDWQKSIMTDMKFFSVYWPFMKESVSTVSNSQRCFQPWKVFRAWVYAFWFPGSLTSHIPFSFSIIISFKTERGNYAAEGILQEWSEIRGRLFESTCVKMITVRLFNHQNGEVQNNGVYINDMCLQMCVSE